MERPGDEVLLSFTRNQLLRYVDDDIDDHKQIWKDLYSEGLVGSSYWGVHGDGDYDSANETVKRVQEIARKLVKAWYKTEV